MTFIFKMAWRDSRASRRRLVLFSLSVVLGIAALVAIGSLGTNLEQAIDDQAKGLLGADLIVTGRSPLSEAAQAYVDTQAVEQAREISFSSMMMFPTANNLTRLVNVRAAEGNFPFYGDFTTTPADAPAKLRAGGAVAIVEETLLRQFNANVGDTVKLGNTVFTVVGALQKLPGESSALSATVAPRALIPKSELQATGLADRNVLVRHRTMLRLPPERLPDVIERDMRRQFRGEGLGYDTVAERRRNLGRALDNIENFLGLVGFVALFLGAIGVASAIHVYIRQKIPTVAVLRCLGATAWQSFAVYLVQGVALGLFGAVVGAALGLVIQVALPRLLADMLPFQVNFFIAWPAVIRGMGAGLVICVLFTLLPLLAVRRVSPLVALRSAFADAAGSRPDPWRIAIVVFIIAAVGGFSIWQTGKVREGLWFTGVLAGSFALLAGLAKAVAWTARLASSGRTRRWLPRWPYVVRQGIANLYRPNNRTVLLLVSLGLGTFLMLTLFLTRTTLLKEIEFSGDGGRPNLLFFDIQDDQIDALVKATQAEQAPVLVQAPIITMKIASVKGKKVEELLRTARERRGPEEGQADGESGRKGKGEGEVGRQGDKEAGEMKGKGAADGQRLPGWTLRREYRSTYRGALTGTERLVSGNFVGKVTPGVAVVPISVEEGLAKEMGLVLGDEIEWDVQGVPIRSKVSSVRAVEWRRLEPNFFVVFPEGVLEPAPKFHVAAVRADNSEHSARVQRAVVTAFPNVTAIDLALVMQTIDGIFTKVAFVVEFMAAFTVLTGIIVLIGAVATGRFQRIRETVLLRTLGATRRQLLQIQLVEYAILGVLAAIVGCALSVLGNTLLAKFVFRITPSVPVLLLIVGALAVCVVTVVTGLLSGRNVTSHPPLEVLRQET
ncbi:ABC transporter permease [Horticoccus sp. 23ND18S-11]|uniref:ABC transporter permease n=1 Tax=Horticoccus sp. 23ND18S-11 TaxID=3391832 RepID=UPI0039C9A4EF